MRNGVRVRFTDPSDPVNVWEWKTISAAARALGANVQSFASQLPREVGVPHLYRGWLIERLDDSPRRRTSMWEIAERAHRYAMAEAEQEVLLRSKRDHGINDDNVDEAIAGEYSQRFSAYLARDVIEEIQWQAAHEQAQKRTKQSTAVQVRGDGPQDTTPVIRQRKRPN